jgi:drug/metabolite transporter (DMT)-like permease
MTASDALKPAIGALFIGLTILFTVTGQLLVKLGMNGLRARPGAAGSVATTIAQAFTNWQVLLGLGCAVAAALCWILAVSKTNLSIAYPFMGLAIALVLALTPATLGEPVSAKQWIGVLIVCAGLWVAAQR